MLQRCALYWPVQRGGKEAVVKAFEEGQQGNLPFWEAKAEQIHGLISRGTLTKCKQKEF